MDLMDDVDQVEIEQIRPALKPVVVNYRLGDDGVFREIPEAEYKAIMEMADKVESLTDVDEKSAFLSTLNTDQLKDLMREFFYRDLYKRMI